MSSVAKYLPANRDLFEIGTSKGYPAEEVLSKKIIKSSLYSEFTKWLFSSATHGQIKHFPKKERFFSGTQVFHAGYSPSQIFKNIQEPGAYALPLLDYTESPDELRCHLKNKYENLPEDNPFSKAGAEYDVKISSLNFDDLMKKVNPKYMRFLVKVLQGKKTRSNPDSSPRNETRAANVI